MRRGARNFRAGARVSREADVQRVGPLFACLLQSVLCTLMLVGAMVVYLAGNNQEVKEAFANLIYEEQQVQQVVAVFSANKPVVEDVEEQGEEKTSIIDKFLTGIFSHFTNVEKPLVELGQGGENLIKNSSVPNNVTTIVPLISTPMTSPLEGVTTSTFGLRSHPISGKADFHTGVDIAATQGTPIVAAWEGVVEEVGENNIYGNYIIIKHKDFKTKYAHCSKILAKEGMVIKGGERIALVGSTGLSTGPHLHFEILINDKSATPTPKSFNWQPV